MSYEDDILRPPDQLISTADPNLDGDPTDGDDDPMMTDDGYTALTPSFDEQDMLEALENPDQTDSYSRLHPQEAYEYMKYQAPLSKAEKHILDTTPFLTDDLSWIDDPGHDDEMFRYQGEKSKAMDNILDDQMYGDPEEQRLVRTGNDGWETGFGFRSIGRGLKRVGKSALKAGKIAINPVAMTKWSIKKTKAVAKMLANMAAWPIKRAVRPIINRTAGNIARKNGRARPSHADVAQANQSVIHTLLNYPLYDPRGSLFRMAGEVLKQLGTGVSGIGKTLQPWDYDTMGNPAIIAMAAAIAVALTASVVALVKASSAHAGAPDTSDAPPDGSVDQVPSDMDPNAMPPPDGMDPGAMPPPDAGYPDPNANPGDAMPYDQSGKLYRSIKDPLDGLSGNQLPYDFVIGPHAVGRSLIVGDSLGGVASAIFGEERRSADEISDDAKKAKRRKDLESLTRAAKAGDPQAIALVTMFAAAETAKERAVSSKDFNEEQNVKVATLAQRAKKGDKKAEAAMNGIMKSRRDRQVAASMGIDPFLYKLNPFYWTKNADKRHFIDAEHKARQREKDTTAQVEKQKETLEYGERAASAQAAAQAVADESIAVQKRLKELKASTASGKDAVSGEFIGQAAAQAGKNHGRAKFFADKISTGQGLSPVEISEFKKLISSHKRLHKFAKQLTGAEVAGVGYHDVPQPKSDLVGEVATEILGKSKLDDMVEIVGKAAAPVTTATQISPRMWATMAALGATNPKKLNEMARQHNVTMTPSQKQQLKAMVILTKQRLKKTMIKGGVPKAKVDGDFIGSWGGFTKGLGRFAVATATLPFHAAVDSYKYVKGKTFGSSSSSPPGTAAPAYAAADARRLAALQRLQAASLLTQKNQAELQAQQDAADAEAAAQAQEDAARQTQLATQELQYSTPGDSDNSDASMGAADGVDSKILGAFVGEWVDGISDPKTKAIVKCAGSKTKAGAKVRAGARVYSAAKKGDPKAKKAIKNVSAKAKTGNPQAQADFNAIKAGKIATDARVKALKTRPALRRPATKKPPSKFVIKQRVIENKTAAKLAQFSRAHQLHKASKVELSAARGNYKANRKIVVIHKKAKAGDKKAKSDLAALMLASYVRRKAPNKAEQKRIKIATKVVKGAQNGKKRDLQQLAVINAAAKKGQPNAKRAIDRLKTAAVITAAITTGAILIPKKKDKRKQTAAAQQNYDRLKGKVIAGTASKEEAFAASKQAAALGKKNEAGALAMKARDLPSQTIALKDTAAIARAAQAGNPQANEAVTRTLQAAGNGSPAAINSAGKLAAVQALDTVNKGGNMSPEMAEATGLVQRAHAGDPEAQKIVKNVGEQVQTNPTPEAVQAAIALTAAGAVAAAIAAKPKAQAQWNAKAAEARGEHYEGDEAKLKSEQLNEITAKVKAGTATPAEAARGKELAMALNKPAMAAQISAVMPPDDDLQLMTSLPDAPLPPIMNWKDMLKESAKALLLVTRNPTQNYREGVASRSQEKS